MFFALIAATTGIVACGGSNSSPIQTPTTENTQPSTPPPPVDPIINAIRFTSANNPQLRSDVELTLNGSTFQGRLNSPIKTKSLIATFDFIGDTVSINNQSQDSGITENDFTNTLDVVVENDQGTKKSYQLNLSNFTGLPIINLTTQTDITSKEEYVLGTFELDGWREFDSIEPINMKIKGRGNSTWFTHPKKPYQMKLESSHSLFGIEEDKTWLFLAEYSDKTLLRNKLAFIMGSLSNLSWTPKGQFAEVVINGNHRGIYHITEKVEDGANRVDIGDTGFLLEIDQPDRLDADDVSFNTNTYLINIKEPKLEEGDEKYQLISSHINEFENVLFSSDFANPVTGYPAYIDIDSFIDWFLINEIAKNTDAQWYSSIYLHYVPGNKITMGPLWDFDLGFGNVDYADSRYPEGWWVRWNTWISRLLEDPAFVSRVKERMAFFSSKQSYLLSEIDFWADKLNLSQSENDAIWQTMGVYVWPNPKVYETYEEEVSALKSWFQLRMAWLGRAVSEL